MNHHVVFGTLIGAIAWNVITRWYGIPFSSSHALIGGIQRALIAKAGVGMSSVRRASAVRWDGVAGTVVWAWIFTIPASAFASTSAFVAGVSCWLSLLLFA